MLIHSYSSVLLDVLRGLSEQGISVEVFASESRPTPNHSKTNGQMVADVCTELGLECKLIPDSAVAVYMP